MSEKNHTKSPPHDAKLKAEDITKNYKALREYEISMALTSPTLAPILLSVIAKLNDVQLKAAIPLMTLDQIKLSIPKLQLQQTGIAVQVMSSAQIRQTLEALTQDDRNILMQNITLLSSSSNKDELQSFISFVDPLALAMTAQMPELSKKILEAAGVMTVEQIRVLVPLLSSQQIRDLILALDHDSQIEVAILMIDKKDDLITVLAKDLPTLVKKKEEVLPCLLTVKNDLLELEKCIKTVEQAGDLDEEYESTVRRLRSTKMTIESWQQSVRQIQAYLKLPLKILSPNEHLDLFEQYSQLNKEAAELGKDLHLQFSRLSSDGGLIALLNKLWQQLKSATGAASNREEVKRPASPTAKESMFEDDASAIELYEAIKEIGNPTAVGTHYSMTWSSIIEAGFRTTKDFEDRNIHSLEALQKFIDSCKGKS